MGRQYKPEIVADLRAAWRKHVDLPHAPFEVLLQDHLRGDVLTPPDDFTRTMAARSARTLQGIVDDLAGPAAAAPLPEIAERLVADNYMCGALRQMVIDPRTPIADKALTAGATQTYLAALRPHLPREFWAMQSSYSAAFARAGEEADYPAAHRHDSMLAAYRRMQELRPALKLISDRMACTGQIAHMNLSRHLQAGLYVAMLDIRKEAEQRAAINMNQKGVVAFRPRPQL